MGSVKVHVEFQCTFSICTRVFKLFAFISVFCVTLDSLLMLCYIVYVIDRKL